MEKIGAMLLAFCLSVAGSSVALAERQVALVLGNSAYRHVVPLPNPVADASSISEMFTKNGFEVFDGRNLDVAQMRRVFRDFAATVTDADVAVIYFAGHGIEIDGVNYLVPVDAALARDTDIEDEAIPVDRLLRVLEPAKRLRLILLDACRDNPFAKTMKRSVATRSVGRGLAKVEPASSDTLIAFAAKAGSTAADGEQGRNSPFTAALVRNISVPGLDLRIALGRVRDDVIRETSSRQEPFVYGSLGGSVVSLVPPAAGTPGADIPPLSVDPNAALRRDYELAAQVGTAQAWESFLTNYPTGFYADLARAQLSKVDAAQKAAREAAAAKAAADAAEKTRAEAAAADRASATAAAEKAKIEAEAKAKAAAAAEKAKAEATVKAAIDAGRARSAPQASAGLRVIGKEPPGGVGALAFGERVLVDDGSCGDGQIKEITGGNNQVPRGRRCVGRR